MKPRPDQQFLLTRRTLSRALQTWALLIGERCAIYQQSTGRDDLVGIVDYWAGQ